MSIVDTLATEKPAIIIDIGQAYTKCGFSGEVGPHSIMPTQSIHELNQNRPIKLHDFKSLLKKGDDRTVQELTKEESDILKELLIEFLYRIYYKTLNSNARERKVVIVESVLTSSFFRRTLADVLFKNFQAVSVMFMPSHLAALYTLGFDFPPI
jgi:actin-related protein 10